MHLSSAPVSRNTTKCADARCHTDNNRIAHAQACSESMRFGCRSSTQSRRGHHAASTRQVHTQWRHIFNELSDPPKRRAFIRALSNQISERNVVIADVSPSLTVACGNAFPIQEIAICLVRASNCEQCAQILRACINRMGNAHAQCQSRKEVALRTREETQNPLPRKTPTVCSARGPPQSKTSLSSLIGH